MIHKVISALFLLKNEPLIRGSFWLMIGGVFINFGGYLFNLLMGRFLSPNEYGLLMSLISLSIIISLPSSIITTVATKFAADFFAKKEFGKLSRMLIKLTQLALIGGIAIIILLLIFNVQVQQFLKVNDNNLIILTGILVGLGLVTSINSGVLRGMLFFKQLSIIGIATIVLKLILGYIFVVRMQPVYGALYAILFSTMLSWALSFLPIIKYFYKVPIVNTGIRSKIVAFSLPAFSITAASTLFLNADLLLVKHYFDTDTAGIYAAAAIMGKAIFYVLGPISIVLFPLISQGYAVKGNIIKEFKLSFLLTFTGGLCGLFIYYVFPEFIVKLFFPSIAYIASSQYIFYYGIYMFLYSLVFLFINYFLAVEHSKISYLILVFSILQLILINYFHSSLYMVINVSIATLCMLLFILFFVSWRHIAKNSHEISR